MTPARLPQRLHQDFETFIPGIEYFPMGNGDIQGMLQYCPVREGTNPPAFLGFTVMDAEKFTRKWSTFLFHPERGFERTMMTLVVDEVHNQAGIFFQ